MPAFDNNAAEWNQVLQGKAVLQLGDVGQSVTKLQVKLTEAGFPIESTGVFGPSTQQVVKAFQMAMQIAATGRVGARSSELLDSQSAPSWQEVVSGQQSLRLGNHCVAVRQAQELLTGAGFPVDASGVFGPTTVGQVKEFQHSRKLKTNGEIGAATAAALNAVRSSRHASPHPSQTSMVRRQGKLMTARTARAFDKMNQAARTEGVVLRLLAGLHNSTPPTGTSTPKSHSVCERGKGASHRTGRALDIDDGRSCQWLRQNARLFGFSSQQPGEPWHWHYIH